MNAVCSFCKRIPPWPSVLAEAGYRIAGIEQGLLVPPAGIVKPDVITLSQKSNCALLWECKSGANVDRTQLDRYNTFLRHASAKDIQRVAGIAFPNPDSAHIEVVYCFLEEAVSRILDVFGQETSTPIVSLGRTTKLVAGSFHDPSLTDAFRPGFGTPPLEQVPWLIVADTDTSDGEFARYLLPTLVACIVKQAQRISITTLLSETLLDWEVTSLDTRRVLKDKAVKILREVCAGEFADHVRFCKPEERRHEETLEIVSEIMGYEPSAQTRALQKLREEVDAAVKRLEEGRPFVTPPPSADQLQLFAGEEPSHS